MNSDYNLKPGDIVTVPLSGIRHRAEVLVAPEHFIRTPFDRWDKQSRGVVAVHLRLLEGLESGQPITVQMREVELA